MTDEKTAPSELQPPASKAKTKSAAAKPPVKKRTPKKVSPEVEAIRAECREKIKALHGAQASNKILQTIVVKRLPVMTQEHKQALLDELCKTLTPKLL